MSVRRSNAFVKKTKVGKVVKVVREHYLREDIHCGYCTCDKCPAVDDASTLKLGTDPQNAIDLTANTAADLPTLLVIDTNILLHQLDLLTSTKDHPELHVFNNLVIPQTAIQEVQARDPRIYQRVKQLLTSPTSTHYVFSNEHHKSTYVERLPSETPNDRNDRAIRVCTQWYSLHLQQQCNIILLTDDRGNQQKALQEGLKCYTMKQYVDMHSQRYPFLVDLLAHSEDTMKSENESRPALQYDVHLSGKELDTALLSGKAQRASFKVSGNHWGEASATVTNQQDHTRQHIYLPTPKHINRAVDGDIVAVEILPKDEWLVPSKRLGMEMMEDMDTSEIEGDEQQKKSQSAELPAMTDGPTDKPSSLDETVPTGRVVGIIERRWRSYAGSLEVTDKQRGNVLFLAVNKRIPKIRMSTRQVDELMDKRIIVQIDSWPVESMYPQGHYVKTIGTIGDREAETQVLLIEHEINTAPWSTAVLRCLPAEENEIDQAHTVGRVDLRESHEIVSIDPPGCTDIDDALHCRPLDNGNFEVGVHIADVSHYVKADTAIDLEAQSRGTSVYLVDRRIDMLPRQLSTNLCSLKSNIDRLTFSVTWEVTPDGKIVDTQFFKGVIRSKRAFSYQQAQEMMDDPTQQSSIAKSLRTLNHIAKQLKAQRIAAGALMLASTEVKFLMDKESSQPSDVEMYQLREANSLVEEFMLLANISVAKHTLTNYPAFALLRRHPTPPTDNFDPLKRAAKQANFQIDTSSSKALANSLDQCEVEGFPFFNKLIRILATRCMTQALYFSSGDVKPSDYLHYGLAAQVYTHFTSPIRRYADIVVHRLLAASLDIDPLPASIQDRARVRLMADNINHRHRMAQLVSRASGELFTMIFFHGRGAVKEQATIIAVRANGIRVIVPRYGLEASIKLSKPKDATDDSKKADDTSTLHYDEENMVLTDATRGYRFCIFEQVEVTIETKETKNRRRWLLVDLVEDCKRSSPIRALKQHTHTDAAVKPMEVDGVDIQEEADTDEMKKFADQLTATYIENDEQETMKEHEQKAAADTYAPSTSNPSIVKRIRS